MPTGIFTHLKNAFGKDIRNNGNKDIVKTKVINIEPFVSNQLCMHLFQFKQKKGMMCWDTLGQPVGGGPIGVSHCHHFGGNQVGG